MISQDTTKSIFDSLFSTEKALFDDQVQNIEQKLRSLTTSAQPPQFSSPISSSTDLMIRSTPLQGESGGLFSALRSNGKVHLGLDLAALIGTGVSAAEDGVVVFAGWARGYGNVVYVNHAGGYQTRYAHLSEINAKEGDSVNQGTIVGLVGKTGNADSPDVDPHVHFEVRKILDQNVQDLDSLMAVKNSQSQPQDPLPFILGHPVVQIAQTLPRSVPQQKTPQQPKKYPEKEDQPAQKQEAGTKTTPETKKKKSLMEKAKEAVRKRTMDKLMKFMDVNGDGGVGVDELKRLFTVCLGQFEGKITKDNLCKILRQQAGIDFREDDVADQLMQALDTNGDHVLTVDEVDGMIKKIMRRCDASGDQEISRDEFEKLGTN